MKFYLECMPCYIRQAVDAAKIITNDRKLQEKILRESLIAASKFDSKNKGILINAKIFRVIKELAPSGDPYRKVKKKFNNICLDMEKEIKEMIRNSKNPFETALRVAIAGNIIDFGPEIKLNEEVIRKTINNSFKRELDTEKILLLKEEMNNSNKILFIGDNAGEIVFDKIFIESLPKDKITYVVRGGPALNDSTMDDAEMVGMTKIVKVITTGLDMPAAILPLCSKEFLNEYKKSDLVIAKGQGNYEALSDENKNIYFLLNVKCPVICKSFNGKYSVGDIVIENKVFLD